jgi:hypothetical protein
VIEVKREGELLLVGGHALSYDEARDLVDRVWAAIPVERSEDGTPICPKCGIEATETTPAYWDAKSSSATATTSRSTMAIRLVAKPNASWRVSRRSSQDHAPSVGPPGLQALSVVGRERFPCPGRPPGAPADPARRARTA